MIYKWICAICGWKYENQPEKCHCGNDCEFEKISGI